MTLWTVAHQVPPSMGFYRQKHVNGLPSPSPGYLPYPGIKPTSFMFPAFAVGSLPLAPSRKPIRKVLKGIFWSMTPWEVWNPQIKEYMRKYMKRSTENCYTIRILVLFFPHVPSLSEFQRTKLWSMKKACGLVLQKKFPSNCVCWKEFHPSPEWKRWTNTNLYTWMLTQILFR